MLFQFLRLLAEEENGESFSQSSDQELALSRAIDAMVHSMEKSFEVSESKKEKHREYENECREKFSTAEVQSNMEAAGVKSEVQQKSDGKDLVIEGEIGGSSRKVDEKPIEEVMLSYQRKLTVLYELLTACLADTHEDNKKCTRKRKGYDARHRVALRLLATWFDVKWIKMVCISNLLVLRCSLNMWL